MAQRELTRVATEQIPAGSHNGVVKSQGKDVSPIIRDKGRKKEEPQQKDHEAKKF
jgi:hypothetical protein